jgi:bifunctional DNA-binding transcriptional regulator/antitoxin component of YhaV-PrlF toxin-antitoxin module
MSKKGTVTLPSTHRIAIPKSVRDSYRWQAGQEIAFIPKPSGVLLGAVSHAGGASRHRAEANPCDYRDGH